MVSQVRKAWLQNEESYPKHLRGEIVSILARVDFVAMLVDLGYIDRALLFKIFGYQFSKLSAFFVNFQTKKDSEF